MNTPPLSHPWPGPFHGESSYMHRKFDLDALLGAIYATYDTVTHITDHDHMAAIWWDATADGLLLHGYTLDCVSSNKLNEGGDMY